VTEGPLDGIKVVELAGIGPGPWACTLLADLGATVIRVGRAGGRLGAFVRGRPAYLANLKDDRDHARVMLLLRHADVLVEGFRPGVAERLGLGPEQAAAVSPGLVYARMTGWGQTGPMAGRVGHDINYIGLTGALNSVGEPGRKPVPPLNLVGDFGGGTMFMLVGILSALIERQRSGLGQVVDAAMVDGVSSLMTIAWSNYSAGDWQEERGSNVLDGGAPYYDTYVCSDGLYMAVGAIEPQFYACLGRALELDLPDQLDRSQWPTQRRLLAERFAADTRDHWTALFKDVDACVSPVLTMTEATRDPHLRARDSLIVDGGTVQPGVAPRLSRTPGRVGEPGSEPGPLADDVLELWGIKPSEWHAL
jgi:alpha-methylacyl-CoA racemase